MRQMDNYSIFSILLKMGVIGIPVPIKRTRSAQHNLGMTFDFVGSNRLKFLIGILNCLKGLAVAMH